MEYAQRLQTLNSQIRSYRAGYKWKKSTTTSPTSRHPSYCTVDEMTGKNTCGVVYDDRKHWTQKDADYSDGDRSCVKGRDKPDYQLEALRAMRWVC